MAKHTHESAVGYLVARAHRRINDDLARRLKGEGASVEVWLVLSALDASGPMTMSDLADSVLVEAPTLTKIIDRMTSAGQVFRMADEQDRRRVLVAISEDGAALLPRLRAHARAHEAMISRHLLATDLTALTRFLDADLTARADA